MSAKECGRIYKKINTGTNQTVLKYGSRLLPPP